MAQPVHPDFTGMWVMDTTRSIRDGLTLTVARVDDTLSVRSEGANAGGAFVTIARYAFDGKPWPNSMGGATIATEMSWEG